MKIIDINTYELSKTFEKVSKIISESENFNDLTLKAILLSIMQIQQIQINLIKDIVDSVRIHNKGFEELIENLKTYNELTKTNTASIRNILDRM